MHSTTALEPRKSKNAPPIADMLAFTARPGVKHVSARMSAQSSTVSDFDLQALVDGELSPHVANNIEERLKNDAVAQRRYAALLQQKQLLQLWWKQFS